MKLRFVLILAVATAGILSAQADTSFFVAPAFRGQAGTEYSGWESFTNALDGPNYPHLAGSTGDGFITQTTPGAFIPGSGNIYSPTTTNTFTLTDATAFTLGTVIFQVRNATGTNPFDYDSVRLEYNNGGGLQALFTMRTELNDTGGGVASLWNWDVSALGINSYQIFFNAADTSLSLDAAVLDVQAVPEPSAFVLLGVGLVLIGRRVGRCNA